MENTSHNNAREELIKKRRRAFIALNQAVISMVNGIFISDIDKILDDFFESGIELARRKKDNGE